MKSAEKVYFASARVLKWRHEESLPGRLERLLKKMDFQKRLEPGEWVAVKTHFGSRGAHRVIGPAFLSRVVAALKAAGAKPSAAGSAAGGRCIRWARGNSSGTVVQDKGILASDDLVAIEKAGIDMLLASAPLPESAAASSVAEGPKHHDILFELHKREYRIQIEHARKLGLGSPDYDLITI